MRPGQRIPQVAPGAAETWKCTVVCLFLQGFQSPRTHFLGEVCSSEQPGPFGSSTSTPGWEALGPPVRTVSLFQGELRLGSLHHRSKDCWQRCLQAALGRQVA